MRNKGMENSGLQDYSPPQAYCSPLRFTCSEINEQRRNNEDLS